MPHFPVCRRRSPSSIAAVLLLLLSIPPPSVGIRSFPTEITSADDFSFSEAPEYRNGAGCLRRRRDDTVHVAMTLDSEYLRGSIAAVHSVLRHATCPENVFFHFIAAEFDPASPRLLSQLVRNTFNSLSFKVYIFREDSVINLISSSIRVALENPLNYARNYLGDILDPGVDRVVYLDSDVVLVDDIKKLWNITLQKNRVIGAPEYCHANFTTYFTSAFWSDPVLSRTFGPKSDQKDLKKAKKREKDENTLWSNPGLSQTSGSDQDLKKAKKREKGENTLWSDQISGSDQDLLKKAKKREKRGPPCYFNTGVMVMDLRKWREGNYRGKIEKWMELQRKKRIYELGSLPPFLLVFAGEVEPIEHRWNQHGLGGDNVKGSCRSLHSGPVSLLHWSGKGKPWVRYDEKRPCPLDHLWKPYDLYRDRDHREEQSQPLDLMGGGGNGGGGHGGNFLGYSNYLI